MNMRRAIFIGAISMLLTSCGGAGEKKSLKDTTARAATGGPDQIATWPDYGLDYKYGGWHLTGSVAFHRGKLYVSVGSSCNVCIEKEDVRATIQELDPDGSHRHMNDQQSFFFTDDKNGVLYYVWEE